MNNTNSFTILLEEEDTLTLPQAVKKLGRLYPNFAALCKHVHASKPGEYVLIRSQYGEMRLALANGKPEKTVAFNGEVIG